MYFIFIFISPSVPRSSVKMSVNQIIAEYPSLLHVPPAQPPTQELNSDCFCLELKVLAVTWQSNVYSTVV